VDGTARFKRFRNPQIQTPMANISLATYTISVRRKRSKHCETLSNVGGEDFLKFLYTFFQNSKSPLLNPSAKSLIKVTRLANANREISGIIETGLYGHTSDLYDTTTDKTSYRRKTIDAEMLPFFFSAYIPPNESTGVLILQRFKTFGIQKIISDNLGTLFSDKYPDLMLDIEPIIHPELLREFTTSGTATKIRFRQMKIPQDICDVYQNKLRPDDGYVEYSIIAKKQKNFRSLDLFSRASGKTLLTIPKPDNFTPDQTLLEIALNGKKRTIDIADAKKLRMYLDISGEVKIGRNGHPLYDSIHDISKGVLKDLWNTIKGV
jgi:hypothetical protein